MQIPLTTIGPQHIGLQQELFAREGARSIPLQLNFNLDTTLEFDLTQFVSERKISAVKSVFVDNADNDTALVMQTGAQQRVVIPPYSQGYIPVMSAPDKGAFAFTYTGTPTRINIQLINVHVDALIWTVLGGTTVSITGVVTVQELSTAPTDQSGNIATGGVSQLAMTVPAGTRECWVANPSALTESLFIRMGAAAGINGQGSIEIPPGSGWSGSVTGAIHVIAATTGHVYTAGYR